MYSTGIIRRMDDLGRVVVPKEIRKRVNLKEGDPFEIYVTNDNDIVLKKYSPSKNYEVACLIVQSARVLGLTLEYMTI